MIACEQRKMIRETCKVEYAEYLKKYPVINPMMAFRISACLPRTKNRAMLRQKYEKMKRLHGEI